MKSFTIALVFAVFAFAAYCNAANMRPATRPPPTRPPPTERPGYLAGSQGTDPMYDNVVNEIEHAGSVIGPQTEGDIQNLVSDLRTIEAGVQLKKAPQITAALGKAAIDLRKAAVNAAKVPILEEFAIQASQLAKQEEQKFAKGKGSFTEINRYVKIIGEKLQENTPN